MRRCGQTVARGANSIPLPWERERQVISDFSDRPAFETIRPRRQLAPIVVNSSHSGRDYPKRFLKLSRLDETAIRHSEDAYVDELFERAPPMGIPLIKAHFPRAYLDVNREPYELDPRMFSDPLPEHFNTTSPRIAAGLGTIARIVSENRPIYRELLTLEDATMRIEGIYKPYHKTLQSLLSETLAQFGVAVLLDCHSMPRLQRGGDKGVPDVVLGDRYGTTCSPALMDVVETVFTGAGLRVARNRPYAGGQTARTYGRPRYGLHCIQIEISRHLYMHEMTLQKHKGFPVIQSLATQLLRALVDLDAVLVARGRDAAE